MVSYQKWTSIGFEVAKSKGMVSSRENSAELVSVLACIWNDRKSELNSATVAEARTIAEREINVA